VDGTSPVLPCWHATTEANPWGGGPVATRIGRVSIKHYLARFRWEHLLVALLFAGFTSCRKTPPPPSATRVQTQTVELINASETLMLTGEANRKFLFRRDARNNWPSSCA
jgi:hypothetical protein